jgi:hypothetical protein
MLGRGVLASATVPGSRATKIARHNSEAIGHTKNLTGCA